MEKYLQEKGIDEAFWPLYELDERPEEGKGSHWFVRIAMALALVGTVWALHVYVPDKAGAISQPMQTLRGSRVAAQCTQHLSESLASTVYRQLAGGVAESAEGNPA